MNLDSREKEIIATPGVPFGLTFERLIGPDSPLVMPFRHLDEYQKGVEQIQRLYKLHQRGGTDHGKLHTVRILFLALAIIQAGKIKLNPRGLTQLSTAIIFHDIGRKHDDVDNGHGKAGREIYKKLHAAPQILPSAFSSNITVLMINWQKNTLNQQIRFGQRNAPGSCIRF